MHDREEQDAYMSGSQADEYQGPVERWTLGGTEFGEFGTNHYGRGPKNYQRNDERIREDIVERLVRNYDIDASEVEIEVSGGEVTLRGTVESRYFKRLIEDIAEDVFGVKDVHNHLRITAS
jgi:osmotically-inducible protein OsmY